MDFELYPTITLRPRSFNALLAPREMFIQALSSHLDLQRSKVLYVCGNYSSILSGLNRRLEDIEVRRAFTVFQLMIILGVKDVAACWARASSALKKEYQAYGLKLGDRSSERVIIDDKTIYNLKL